MTLDARGRCVEDCEGLSGGTRRFRRVRGLVCESGERRESVLGDRREYQTEGNGTRRRKGSWRSEALQSEESPA